METGPWVGLWDSEHGGSLSMAAGVRGRLLSSGLPITPFCIPGAMEGRSLLLWAAPTCTNKPSEGCLVV